MEHFFKFLFSFWGVLGKRMLNPEVLKCHKDLITLDTYVQQGKTIDNKFYIYVKTLTSLAIMGARYGTYDAFTHERFHTWLNHGVRMKYGMVAH